MILCPPAGHWQSVHKIAGNPGAFAAFITRNHSLEDAMERERTPVEARGGVISGRIVKILVISSVGAAIAMAGVWAVLAMPH